MPKVDLRQGLWLNVWLTACGDLTWDVWLMIPFVILAILFKCAAVWVWLYLSCDNLGQCVYFMGLLIAFTWKVYNSGRTTSGRPSGSSCGLPCPTGKVNILEFIHSDHFYSAFSSPHLLRSAPDTARILCRVSRRRAQAAVGKGLAQGPYVVARAGVEPMTLRLKSIDLTNAPPRTRIGTDIKPAVGTPLIQQHPMA